MIISDDFIFIHNPKCAGSFVDNLTVRMFESASFNGHRHDTVRQINKKHQGKPVFGTIRNPWDWWVSWYSTSRLHELHDGTVCDTTGRPSIGTFRGFWENVFSRNHMYGAVDLGLMNEIGIGPYTYRFVIQFFRNPDAAFRNWDVDRIKANIGDLMPPIHFCRVEDLRKEMLQFFNSINLELTPEQVSMLMDAPVDNASKHGPTESYYDEYMSTLTKEKDRLLVELYGYSEPWE